MSESHNHSGSTLAPLQARIAGVALATTVLALVAACLCFMLQQWSVARQEAREEAGEAEQRGLLQHQVGGERRALREAQDLWRPCDARRGRAPRRGP